MTKEEAIKMASAKRECLNRWVTGKRELCDFNNCDECNLNYEHGNVGDQIQWLTMAIEALKQPEVVRCKDCKDYVEYDDFDRDRAETFSCHECRIFGKDLGENGYCSLGERKDDE